MNVLQVYRTPFPDTLGGVDVVVADLLRAPPSLYRSTLLRTAEWTAGGLSCSKGDGVTVYGLHLPMPAPGLARLAFLWRVPATLRALRRVLTEAAIDVIHLHTLQHYHLYFVLLRRLGGPPYVITLHRAEVLAYQSRGALTRWTWRVSLRNAAAVVAVAGWLAECARRTLPVPVAIRTVENGVELPPALPDGATLRERLGLPERYCIMVGTCEPYKAHVVAIRAWAELPQRHADVALVLVGTGELLPHYRKLAAELGIGGRLHLTGQLTRAEVLALVRNSLAFIMPSRSEGMSIALLEAGIAGAPVICSDIEPFARLIEAEQTALVFAVDDQTALAHAVLRMLDDDALRERLARALADSVRQRYTADRMRRQYSTIYREAAGRLE